MQQRSIIITAGGTGKRMNSVQPKQFLLLHGKPILLHTLERLYQAAPDAQFIITLPQDQLTAWNQLCKTHLCTIRHLVLAGGAERYHSVKKALDHCMGGIIAVHDGVRPLVSTDTLARLFKAALTHNAVIPVADLKESLRKLDEEESHAVPRGQYKVVQTPQVFRADVLRRAYELPYSPTITDDAGLVEESGTAIFLVEGNEENIKITTQTDLAVAEYLLGK